jgi:hypothetical protein
MSRQADGGRSEAEPDRRAGRLHPLVRRTRAERAAERPRAARPGPTLALPLARPEHTTTTPNSPSIPGPIREMLDS